MKKLTHFLTTRTAAVAAAAKRVIIFEVIIGGRCFTRGDTTGLGTRSASTSGAGPVLKLY